MMQVLSLKNLDVKGKRVLIRVDFNVPLDKSGKITDATRIQEVLPSINYVLEHGGALILMSHLGRPNGKRDLQYSLKPCAEELAALLGKPVVLAPDCIGTEVEGLARKLKPGGVILLENLRFYEAEEKPEKDPTFAKQLAGLGDCYVNDAFGTAHRAHSSTCTIAQHFKGRAAAGFLMEREIAALRGILESPRKPFFALIGGAKVSTKMGILQSLLKKVDTLLIGGGMAYTFFKAEGISIGDSIHEDDQIENAKALLKQKHKLHLPIDLVIARSISEKAETRTIPASAGIPSGWQGVDIGPETVAHWKKLVEPAATFFWNGPVGVFEIPPFAKGTEEIAKIISSLSATTVVGGGDSVAAISQLGLKEKFSHVSTGGGASLEFIEFGHLPGIDALSC
jgi:phosphoglycerate kinase